MQYRLNGRLLFAENEQLTRRIYTHAVLQGDRVIRIHTSLAAAEDDLAGLRAEAVAYGQRLRAVYDRRMMITDLKPDQGSVVRAPGIDAMYPTQPELAAAIERQRAAYKGLRIEALEISC